MRNRRKGFDTLGLRLRDENKKNFAPALAINAVMPWETLKKRLLG